MRIVALTLSWCAQFESGRLLDFASKFLWNFYWNTISSPACDSEVCCKFVCLFVLFCFFLFFCFFSDYDIHRFMLEYGFTFEDLLILWSYFCGWPEHYKADWSRNLSCSIWSISFCSQSSSDCVLYSKFGFYQRKWKVSVKSRRPSSIRFLGSFFSSEYQWSSCCWIFGTNKAFSSNELEGE